MEAGIRESAGRAIRRWLMAFRMVLREQAVRTGIKWAISGVVCFYLALLIRLENPMWAVATAFLCLTPKYVGAIGEKMVLRIIGAITGAALGYLITGSLQQSPVLFLLAVGTSVSVGTMMLGGTFVPYGFYQFAYTLTIVAAQGLNDPENSWRIGIARCEEIVLGIIVTAVVTTCLWPRYARKEFVHGARGMIGELGGLFRMRAHAFLNGFRDEPPDVLTTVGGRLSNLGKMIRIGCMESASFRSRQPSVARVVSELSVLSTAISNLGRTLPAKSVFRDYIEGTITELHVRMADLMSALASGADDRAGRLVKAVGESLVEYRRRLDEFRAAGEGEGVPVEESLEHSGYAVSIWEIHDSLAILSRLLPEIEGGLSEGVPVLRVEKLSMPGREWVLGGIRGGLAVVLGLFLTNWLHPPGGDLMVVGAYLFAGFSFSNTDRMGDLGAFTGLVKMTCLSVVFFVFLLFAAPLMSSYAVLNICLGAFLFLCGYLVERNVFDSFEIFFALLMVLIMIGLNAQHPVPFQKIVDPVMGLILATVLSAVIRRLLWPGLPQNALRARLAGLLGLLQMVAERAGDGVPVPVRAKIAAAAADAITLVGVIDGVTIPTGEADHLRSYIRTLARLGGHLVYATGAENVPVAARGAFEGLRKELFNDIARRLTAQRKLISRLDPEPAERANASFERRIAECRKLIRAAGRDALESVFALGILYRMDQAGRSVGSAETEMAAIDLPGSFADSVL